MAHFKPPTKNPKFLEQELSLANLYSKPFEKTTEPIILRSRTR